MAERGPIIPENQLLGLIRNPPKARGLIEKQMRERTRSSFFSPVALKGRLSFFSEKIKLAFKKTSYDLNVINWILVFLTVVFLIGFIGYFISFLYRLNHIPDIVPTAFKVPGEAHEETAGSKQISDYLDKSRARDIFKFGDSLMPAAETVPQPEEVAPLEDYNPLSHLSLVGISFSDDPDVMIKDTKNQKILFLKRGEWIDEKIQVKRILRDRVVLSYDGREIELR